MAILLTWNSLIIDISLYGKLFFRDSYDIPYGKYSKNNLHRDDSVVLQVT